MDIFSGAERLMGMDEQTWARHANPKSVFSRIPILPLLSLAIWSRVWIGWWCLVPIALMVFWTWINPRIFNEPASSQSWAYQGVMGERIFLARREFPIGAARERVAYLLVAGSATGVLVLGYGLIVLDAWAVACGNVLAVGAKIWFVDRMAWLYQETHRSPAPTATGADRE